MALRINISLINNQPVNKMLIIVADNNDVSVAASNAFRPNCDNNILFLGTNAPIPPICIPIDAKLAKLHIKYIATIIDLLETNSRHLEYILRKK